MGGASSKKFDRAKAKIASSDYAGAMVDYDKAIRLKPDDAEAYFKRGLAKRKQGDHAGAIVDYAEAIHLKPDLVDYDKAIRLKPDDAEAYFKRGLAKRNQGDRAGAIVDYTEAIRLKPGDAMVYYSRGYTKRQQGDYEGAIADYTEAIRLKSDEAIYYNSRGAAKHDSAAKRERDGAIEHDQPGYKGAIADYTEAIRLKSDEAIYYNNRANAFEKLKKDPKDPEAQDDRDQAKFIKCRNSKIQLYKAISHEQQDIALQCLCAIHEQEPTKPPVVLTPQGEELALFTLACFGHTTWLPAFLKHTRPDVEDTQKNSALHVAAAGGHSEFFNALLEENILKGCVGGGYQWPVNQLGETPLHAAARAGKANFLIRCKEVYNAEQDLQATTADGDGIVHLMVRYGHLEPLKTLLLRFSFLSVRSQNHAGQDPLMLALSQKPTSEQQRQTQREMVRFLLTQHIDLANRDAYGHTALHLAVQGGDETLVEMLLDKGALLTACDHAGKQPAGHVSPDSIIGLSLAKKMRAAQNPRQHMTQTPREWRNLVFQGGSVKGVAYPSALRALVEQGIVSLDKIKCVGGASAGAITALLVGLGYSLDEIDHLSGITSLKDCDLTPIQFVHLLDGPFGEKLLAAKNQNWAAALGTEDKEIWEKIRKIASVLGVLEKAAGLSVFGPINTGVAAIDGARKAVTATVGVVQAYGQLSENLAFCPGEELYKLFDQLTQRKLSQKLGYDITTPVTFAELHEAGFKGLYFVGVNTRTGEAEYFSHEHTPDMLIANAVRISMSIPGVFYPTHKKVKSKQGMVTNASQDLYIDGGVSLNYPIRLFDFARYGDDRHLPPDHPQINRNTLGLRLVSPNLKARYETRLPEGELTPEEAPIPTLFNHIKQVLNAIYGQQESDHALNGDSFRTVYINTLDIGMLDFERVEEDAIKKLLGIQGVEGVNDFRLRIQQDVGHHVKLPKPLEKAYRDHSETLDHKVEHGQHITISQLNPNCPALVVEFYAYEGIQIHSYLHNRLGVSLWARDEAGMTAFHIAAQTGNIGALRRLLQAASDGALAKNTAGQLPHELPEAQKYPEVIELLKEQQSRSALNTSSSSVSNQPSAPLSFASSFSTQSIRDDKKREIKTELPSPPNESQNHSALSFSSSSVSSQPSTPLSFFSFTSMQDIVDDKKREMETELPSTPPSQPKQPTLLADFARFSVSSSQSVPADEKNSGLLQTTLQLLGKLGSQNFEMYSDCAAQLSKYEKLNRVLNFEESSALQKIHDQLQQALAKMAPARDSSTQYH